jgi:O-acetyl-ADP-ribose deacetylase (regulator of RNase III)
MIFMTAHMDIRNVPDEPHFAVAHCIAADLCWGSGVAPIINREMFDAESKCRYKCSTNPDGVASQLKVGEILPVVSNKRKGVLINLITKLRSPYKPTYESLTEALQSLKNYACMIGITRIYMPKIGCGIDMLSWDVVQQIIKGVFYDTPIDIIIAYKD